MSSIGEDRVRVKFNPSASGDVELIKQKSAELINIVDRLRADIDPQKEGEVHRLVSLAQTHYETAAMWAVKAATA